MSEVLESGGISYLYRPKVDSDDPTEVQHLYILLRNSRRFRLLIVGTNRLPADESRGEPEGRNWVLVRTVTEDAEEIAGILAGGEYETSTEGTRHLPPAAPIGEGRYALMRFGDSTQLIHSLDRFSAGDFVGGLGLKEQGFFVIAVRNPEVEVEGFPDEDPGYPEALSSLFRGRRWLPVINAGLLDHEGAQLTLMAGFEVDTGALDGESALRTDDLPGLDLPRSALETGEAPDRGAFDRRHREPMDVEFGVGNSAGGRTAARASASASAVASLMAGMDFPASKKDVLAHAEANRDRLEDAEPALQRLEALPRGEFGDMAGLEEAVSKAAGGSRFECEHCDEVFDQHSDYRQHRLTSHPERAVTAADLQRAVQGVAYPAGPDDLARQARDNDAADRVVETLEALPDREYRDAAELSKAFQEAITGIDRSGEPAPSKRSAGGESAAALANALEGIDLPTGREGLLEHARSRDASEALLERIEAMPDRKYRDFAEIEQGFSET